MMIKPRLPGGSVLPVLTLSAALALGGGFAIDAASASAETINAQHEVSSNWAGYVVQNNSGESYTAASGSWNVPKVTSKTGHGYSADWVGIGGASKNSKALEQTGTSSNVVNGRAQYSAWYEIVPAAESRFNLTVHPGDHMYARVTVDGSTVKMSLSDQTTGHSVSKTEHPSTTDTSSAEWIEEAPSVQTPGGRDQVLPLADFDKAKFGSTYATAGGRVGSISDSDWTAEDVQLRTGASFTLPGASAGAVTLPGITVNLPSSGDATPGSLTKGGSSFPVSYSSGNSTTSSGYGRAPGSPILTLASDGSTRLCAR